MDSRKPLYLFGLSPRYREIWSRSQRLGVVSGLVGVDGAVDVIHELAASEIWLVLIPVVIDVFDQLDDLTLCLASRSGNRRVQPPDSAHECGKAKPPPLPKSFGQMPPNRGCSPAGGGEQRLFVAGAPAVEAESAALCLPSPLVNDLNLGSTFSDGKVM
jgi:hypothetical protein